MINALIRLAPMSMSGDLRGGTLLQEKQACRVETKRCSIKMYFLSCNSMFAIVIAFAIFNLVGCSPPAPGPGEILAETRVFEDIPPEQAGQPSYDTNAIFTFKNEGGTPVKILGLGKSCGCAEPNVTPTTLGPGEQGTLRVKALRPSMGDRTVQITMETDSPITPILTFEVRSGSLQQPPFIQNVSGSLVFRDEEQARSGLPFEVIAVQREEDDRVIEPKCNIPGARIDAIETINKQHWRSTDIVLRNYKFRLRFERNIPFTECIGEVGIPELWDGGLTQTLLVRCIPEPDLRVAPSQILIRWGKSARVFVRCRDPEWNIRTFVDPPGGVLTVESIEENGEDISNGYRTFRISGTPMCPKFGNYTFKVVAEFEGKEIQKSIPIEITSE